MDENILQTNEQITKENYTTIVGHTESENLIRNVNSDRLAIWGIVLTVIFGVISIAFGIISILNGIKIEEARKEVEKAKKETERIKKLTEKSAAEAINQAKETIKRNLENLDNTIYRSNLNKVADSVRKVVFPEIDVKEDEFKKNVKKAINEFFSEISKIHRDIVYSKVKNEVDSIIKMQDYFSDSQNFDTINRSTLENRVSDILNMADDISRKIVISTKEEI